MIPESKPRRAAGQLSEPAKGERAERRGGGGSPQRADWQAKDRLLLSQFGCVDTAGAHNLVVWTQQGLLIWLCGHSRGSRFGCVDTAGAYDLVVWTQQGLTIWLCGHRRGSRFGCVDTAGAHDLVVWTQQGLTIWLCGHSRGSAAWQGKDELEEGQGETELRRKARVKLNWGGRPG